MKKGLYNCGERGCTGHTTFAQTCSNTVVQVDDYPGLKPFQDVMYQFDLENEQPTEPSMPITDEMLSETKSGGRATQEMKAYTNKAWFTPKSKQKIR